MLDLRVTVSCFLWRKGSKVVSKSQITLCDPMKTHLFYCFVAETSLLVVSRVGNNPANSHLAAILRCCS